MDASESQKVDHINGDKLDNRNENLRLCTIAENIRNQKLRKDSASGIQGVCFSKDKRKWRAHITINYKTKHLGYFNSKDDAAKARSKAERQYFGEFAVGQVRHR
jgi:2'-5' RNA ligase